MPDTLTFYAILEIIALATGAFLGIHFLTLKSENKSSIYLGLFLFLAFCPDTIIKIAVVLGFESPVLEILPNTALIYPPFLLFYSQAMSGHSPAFNWKWFIPGALAYLVKLTTGLWDADLFFFIEHLFTYLFGIFIFFLILKTIHQHQRSIFKYFSFVEDRTLNWLRILSIILVAFNVLWFVEEVLRILFEKDFFLPEISAFATIVTVYWIGFSSLRQPEIFKQPVEITNIDEPEKELNPIEIVVKEKLMHVMIADKPFAKADLTLRELARQLEVSEKVLSRVINVSSGQNFYRFINEYRVAAFKEKLNKEALQTRTMIGIAQEAGFSSKSTFYDAFKNVEGCTPSQYLKRVHSEQKHSDI